MDQKTRTLAFLIAEGCAAGGAPIGLFLGNKSTYNTIDPYCL